MNRCNWVYVLQFIFLLTVSIGRKKYGFPLNFNSLNDNRLELRSNRGIDKMIKNLLASHDHAQHYKFHRIVFFFLFLTSKQLAFRESWWGWGDDDGIVKTKCKTIGEQKTNAKPPFTPRNDKSFQWYKHTHKYK